MQIVLRAKSTDEGGIKGSFEKQLSELGGETEVVEEVDPYRVDTSDGWYFEAVRTYDVKL